MHAWRRRKAGNYAVRLREKQKVKRYYGVLESQFMVYFKMAERGVGNTGETLLTLLERRLTTSSGSWALRPHTRRLVWRLHTVIST
jgi:small subunit ribosomal protein S4